MKDSFRPEWPTLILLAGCYAVWFAASVWLAGISVPLAIVVLAVAAALHGSLTHEIVHGHPFPGWPRLNAALVALPLTLLVPFGRFRDTHLAHHKNSILTDPYDDPESNYLAPKTWARLPAAMRRLLVFNNTLAGRMLVGPAVGYAAFMWADVAAMRAGDRRVTQAWLWHLPFAGLVVCWLVAVSPLPVWAWALSIYGAMSIIRVRTFLEHQAHERASGRSAIVEDQGILAFLFLNNNLHAVHHAHPKVAWYRLPRVYRANAELYKRRNGGYVYRSYADVFRRYFLRRKDPVVHPHM